MKKIPVVIILSLLLFVVLSNSVFAVSWWPLVPCGTSANPAECTRCDLFRLFKNIIDFVLIGLMPPVAAILFVWGGFLILMGGANPGWITQGRTIFWNTFMGVLIISSSWLITNTIIKSLADESVTNPNAPWYQFECRETIKPPPGEQKYGCNSGNQCVADPNGPYTTNNCDNQCQAPPGGAVAITTASLPGGTLNQSYSQQLAATGGATPYSWSKTSGTLPSGLNLSQNGTISGTLTGTITGNVNFTVKVTDNSTPQQSATKQLSIVVATGVTTGVACLQSNLNLCQPQSTNCNTSACSQYVPAINQYAGRTGIANGANLIKSIMMKESACDVRQVSFDGSSFGLMQFRPSTANIYKSRCGVTANITSAWLTNPANANASICLAAEYIKALSQTSCGNTARGIAAGYNGGSGACNNSVDCSGETSCAGGLVKRWECLYDDTAHKTCNTGYDETRDYATKVLFCYNNPGF